MILGGTKIESERSVEWKKVEKMKIKKINMVSVRFALETKIFG